MSHNFQNNKPDNSDERFEKYIKYVENNHKEHCDISYYADEETMQQRNQILEKENLDLKTKLQKMQQIEAELRSSKMAAEDANSIKSDFLAMMSHEIRTPMNGVIGMTSLLLDTQLTSEQRDFVETIRISGESLITLINEILDFSKIESGKLVFEEAPFELRNCIEDSLDIFTHKAIEKGLDLLYLIEPNVAQDFISDITRIRQVIVNLVNNAIKFTEKGEVFIKVKKISEYNGIQEICFAVKDTGIGIPKDKINILFEDFIQVDASTTRKYGGTGLGLAISRRLVNLMGGNIWVESIEGIGSTFYFTLKLKTVAQNTPKVYVKGKQAEFQDTKVLVVDDNHTNRIILNLQLESWGMKPVLAESGAQALQILKNDNDFRIAILDMQMPEMDGLQLANIIKTQIHTRNISLILLTSMGDLEHIPNGVFETKLSKPIRMGTLFDHLLIVLQEKNKKDQTAKFELNKSLSDMLPLRILIAEDNMINQKLVISLLGKMGYRVDAVSNGKEAVESMKRQKYDIVFMDIQMPEMNGLEATKNILKNSVSGDRPNIIAMTANVMHGDKEKCLEAGMVDYLSKPIRFNEVEQTLIKWGKNAS